MTRPHRSPPGAPRAHPARTAPQQIRIIGGDWKRTPLPVLDVEGLRPTPDRVRETLFNWLGQRLDGQACLDLFSGSGALGFEAASRGASRVLMVERDARAARQLRDNRARLSAASIEVVEADALRLVAGLAPGTFDVVFLDPPFAGDLLARVLPQAMALVASGGALYVEAAAALAAPPGWRIARSGRAGMVHYHLLRRENEE